MGKLGKFPVSLKKASAFGFLKSDQKFCNPIVKFHINKHAVNACREAAVTVVIYNLVHGIMLKPELVQVSLFFNS